VFAVVVGGMVKVRMESKIAKLGIIYSCDIPNFNRLSLKVTTATPVTSLPVPEVVGMGA